jgi:membrane-anchored glycerophosphoryl diester phosphodiesterase (GDPDase)
MPVPFAATFTVLNTTALVKSSTAALPFGTILVVIALFVFVALPLTVVGGIAGHHSSEYEPPCRVSKVPRQVPAVPFYRSLPAQLFMAGFLPFSAISIELHYIFASVWGHKVRMRTRPPCAGLLLLRIC